MNIVLFSRDQKLSAFCREVLAEMFGAEAHLEIAGPSHKPAQQDLCLWDYVAGESNLPRDFDAREIARHLFLLRRQDLPALHESLGTDDVHVMLKPVTAATLRAFLGERVRAYSDGCLSQDLQTLRVERDEMLQFLIQANLRLQEYDQERTNFLARSVHDFRAPLTAIGGYCSLLLEEELGPLTPDQRDVLGRMQQSTKRLSRISNAMFQLSLRQKGDNELDLRSDDLRECVDQALHEVALYLEDKRISLSVDIAPPPPGLLFDRSRIEQTLVNLLDNARKFTPRNGTIEIRGYSYFWERRNGSVASLDPSRDRRVSDIQIPNSYRVDIRDSGPGVPTVHAAKIFEEYSSYSGGQDRSGGGLGLAICRLILQQHGGRVWAESDETGALFCFVLPLQSKPAPVLNGPEGHDRAWLASVEEGWT